MDIMGEEVICQSLLFKTSEVSESFSFQKLKVFKSIKIATYLAHVGLTMLSRCSKYLPLCDYDDFQLSEARRNLSEYILTLKSCCCHWQLQ